MHIRNIGIIDDIIVNFEEGLNILTGETGAGKSLIIDSINAITGTRMSKDIIKYGESMALVEACFFCENENIILSREFFQNGRSVCKINGRMATLSELKELGESLIDIHGQHDNQSLLNEKTHLSLLDSFASQKLSDIMEDYKKNLEEYKEILNKLKECFGDPTERARRIDLLKYQKDEIEMAKLKIDEEETLTDRRNLIMNSEKIVMSLAKARDILSEGVVDGISVATHEILGISNIDKKYEDVASVMNDAYFSLKEVEADLNRYVEEVSFDEEEQNEIEERLDLIFSLKRKYGSSIQNILEYLSNISEELSTLENADEFIEELQSQKNEKENILKGLALKIRNVRKEFAKTIEEKVNKELQDLEMKKSYIKFNFFESESFLESGMDVVQIMISTNVGEGLKQLSKIASGGEISRVMLALKTVLCTYDQIPTMIFDEIDTGISGQAGKAVAEKMKRIGKSHQVITVTHLPVIAASGDTNYFIEKVIENERTITKIRKLNEKETVEEVARILAGNELSDAVLKHAKELRKKGQGDGSLVHGS